MTPSKTFALDEIDLADIAFWERPLDEREAAFLTLRQQKPLASFREPLMEGPFPGGDEFRAVVKYQDILDISKNPELFASGKGATSIADLPEFLLDYFGSMINMDDPRHARLRKIVSAGFTPKMLKNVEDQVAVSASKIVDDLLKAGGGDFVTDVAARLPLKIICDMMGIPESQYDMVFTRSNIILGAGDPEYVEQTDMDSMINQLLTAGSDLHQLMADLAKFRRETPTGDLTSALVNGNVDGESLTDAELGAFFILLVVAGNETTRNAIAHGLDLLTKNPEQKAIWTADIEGTTASAVEEIVRVASPVVWMRRTTTRPTVLRGEELPTDTKLILYYWSANRDADVFDDPFRFDVRRSPNSHVGFGGPGPHFCLGAHLARREISVMFRELLTRVPGLVATGEPARLRSSFINGIKHLECSVG